MQSFGYKPFENIQQPGLTGFLPTLANAAAENIGKNLFGGGGDDEAGAGAMKMLASAAG
jgi:hypothetical protein